MVALYPPCQTWALQKSYCGGSQFTESQLVYFKHLGWHRWKGNGKSYLYRPLSDTSCACKSQPVMGHKMQTYPDEAGWDGLGGVERWYLVHTDTSSTASLVSIWEHRSVQTRALQNIVNCCCANTREVHGKVQNRSPDLWICKKRFRFYYPPVLCLQLCLIYNFFPFVLLSIMYSIQYLPFGGLFVKTAQCKQTITKITTQKTKHTFTDTIDTEWKKNDHRTFSWTLNSFKVRTKLNITTSALLGIIGL